jgi:peptidoglycan/xylan/chitin deacetylase (PgdA/CDA1 family)
VLAQGSLAAAATPTTARSQAPAAVARPGTSCPGNPDALGISRVVEIDTAGGPGFGFEQFKTHDFLREGEVVLTFDDGPWPKNTQAVLAALAAHCTKAIFFPIGLHATYEPAILKQVAAAGHAIGSHTWCHQDLSKIKGTCLVNGKRESVEYDPKDEIEKGISAVHWAVGGPTAPYFRFPALKQPPELVEYLGKRNIGIFSTDIDSFDFKMRKPEQVRQAVLLKLKKQGKGKILNFSRAGGVQSVGPMMLAYNCAKAGVDALTRTFAKEGKNVGIYVNAIGPGLIVTQSNLESMKPSPEDLSRKWVSMEQIVEAVIFLVSPASDGITGAILPVQGKGIYKTINDRLCKSC